MREHDTKPRPEIQTTRISPRGFPIKIGEKIIANRERAYQMYAGYVAKWNGGTMEMTGYNYPNPKEWTLENIPGRKRLGKITVKDVTIALKEHQDSKNHDAEKKTVTPENTVEIPWRQISGSSIRNRNKKRHRVMVSEHTA